MGINGTLMTGLTKPELKLNKINKKPSQSICCEGFFDGAEGQNRTADTGIFRPNFGKFENAVITNS
jgi:hypothetical protein